MLDRPKGGIIGGRRALADENAELRASLEAIGAIERERIRADIARLDEERRRIQAASAAELLMATTELERVRAELVTVREEAILQEVGVYQYRHPLDDAVAYKGRLSELQDRIKVLARREGGAVSGATSWTVNGSATEGRRMVRDFSKLMLRAYNNEADNAVRRLRPYALESAVDRLEKARGTISRLGRTMSIEITEPYHRLRVQELELTADYAAKAAEEKERERDERERLREEQRAQKEFEREKAKLIKEAGHYQALADQLRTQGDETGARAAEEHLVEVRSAIGGIEDREANIRAGYVYVISNVGSFGEGVVKIGMTRRLDPLDRVRELGDASVPFRYDVHAMIFSHDAVTLETKLHQALAAERLNLVNMRREFFYATPARVLELLSDFEGRDTVLSFEEHPEAAEWHQSVNTRRSLAGDAEGDAGP